MVSKFDLRKNIHGLKISFDHDIYKNQALLFFTLSLHLKPAFLYTAVVSCSCLGRTRSIPTQGKGIYLTSELEGSNSHRRGEARPAIKGAEITHRGCWAPNKERTRGVHPCMPGNSHLRSRKQGASYLRPGNHRP